MPYSARKVLQTTKAVSTNNINAAVHCECADRSGQDPASGAPQPPIYQIPQEFAASSGAKIVFFRLLPLVCKDPWQHVGFLVKFARPGLCDSRLE